MRVFASIRQLVKNSLGLIAAQILNLFFIPILSRIYKPADFGEFGLYFTISIILAGVASAKYQDAISTTRSKNMAEHLVAISLALAAIVTLIALPILICIFAYVYDSPETGFLCGISTISIAVCAIGLQISIREERSTTYSLLIFFASGLAPILQFALNNSLGHGLIWGATVAHLIAAFYSLTLFPRMPIGGEFSTVRRLAAMRKYQSFSRFSLPGFLFSNLRTRLMYLLAPIFSNATFLGYYSQVDRVITAPSSLSATALKPLVTKVLKDRRISAQTLFTSCLQAQWFLLAIPLSLFILKAELIVLTIFGKQWHAATELLQIMLVPGFLMMTTNWLDRILDFNRIHKVVIWLEVFFLICGFIAVLSSGILGGPIWALSAFCIIITTYYLSWLFIIAKSLHIPGLFLAKTTGIFFLLLTCSLLTIPKLENIFGRLPTLFITLIASCVTAAVFFKKSDVFHTRH